MKEFLSRKGVQYSERDVSRDMSAAAESYRVSGQTGIPVTVIDNEVIVGFDQARLEEALAASRPSAARRPFGLRVADSSKMARSGGPAPVVGAYVDRVAPGSPAEKGGLQAGDIVTEINTRDIGSAAGLEQTLAAIPAGSRISIVFVRGNQRRKTEAIT